MHVDFRPRLLLLLGLALALGSVLFGYMDIVDRYLALFKQVQHAYQAKHGVELDLLDYLGSCLPKAGCRAAYSAAGGVGPWTLLLLHTSLMMGLLFAAVARFWKPERWFRRQVRVVNARMRDYFEQSSTKPQGTLVPERVGRA